MKSPAEKGFTILEVMVVVILISILAAIVIPRYVVSARRAQVQACEMNRHLINKEVEMYFFAEATWPNDDLGDIKTNANYFPDGIPTCPVDFSSYILVPIPTSIKRVSGHREGAGTHIWW